MVMVMASADVDGYAWERVFINSPKFLRCDRDRETMKPSVFQYPRSENDEE